MKRLSYRMMRAIYQRHARQLEIKAGLKKSLRKKAKVKNAA